MTMLLVRASNLVPGMPVIVSHDVDEVYGIVAEKAINVPEGRFIEVLFIPCDFNEALTRAEKKSSHVLPKAFYRDTEWGSLPYRIEYRGNLIALFWTGNTKDLHFYVPLEECLPKKSALST